MGIHPLGEAQDDKDFSRQLLGIEKLGTSPVFMGDKYLANAR